VPPCSNRWPVGFRNADYIRAGYKASASAYSLEGQSQLIAAQKILTARQVELVRHVGKNASGGASKEKEETFLLYCPPRPIASVH
jgi:hypothetical protein